MIYLTTIIPVYNGEKYINRCAENLLEQTYSNFYAVFIDDGSTDGSAALLDAWRQKDPRFHVIHTENHGVSAARNCGIDYVIEQQLDGYVHFVDVDDDMDKTCYSDIMQLVEGHETMPDIVAFGYTTLYHDKVGGYHEA